VFTIQFNEGIEIPLSFGRDMHYLFTCQKNVMEFNVFMKYLEKGIAMWPNESIIV
jgi:hypothetical protein